MTGLLNEPSVILAAALGQFPPIIREEMLSDSAWCSKNAVSPDAAIALGNAAPSFTRSTLFDGIRSVFGGVATAQVKDRDDRVWLISVGQEDLPSVLLTNGRHRFIMRNMWPLHPDPATRVRCFNQAAVEFNLDEAEAGSWVERIRARSVTDGEVAEVIEAITKTPVQISRQIEADIVKGESAPNILVPTDARYLHMLVGAYDGSKTVDDYVRAVVARKIEQNIRWQPVEGMKASLLLSSHALVWAEIDTALIPLDAVLPLYDDLAAKGDLLSQVGAIEVGFRILSERPALIPRLEVMIRNLREEDPDAEVNRYGLLSALFVFADAQISSSRTARDKPPFWRRMAAFAQASMVERATIGKDVDISEFKRWLLSFGGQQFYLQSLVDLRSAPRWSAEYISPSQLKAEFLGRIVGAARLNLPHLQGTSLEELVLGAENSVQSQLAFPNAFLPGPLEGASRAPQAIGEELAAQIRAALKEPIDRSSFNAFINASMILSLEHEFADLASEALRSAKYSDLLDQEGNLAKSWLYALANAATASRSPALTLEIKNLLRRQRHQANHLEVEDEFLIGLASFGSYEVYEDWAKQVGDWCAELSRMDISSESAARMRAHILMMCVMVPELWRHCGNSDAALASIA